MPPNSTNAISCPRSFGPGQRIWWRSRGCGRVTACWTWPAGLGSWRRATDDVGPGGRVVGLDLNSGMLAVARSAAVTEDRVIEWCESSALSMPFADQSFDMVFCQQGLQFFPDRRAGLREMHRVLVERGHLMVSAWRSIEHSPVMLAFAAALEQHIGPGASAIVRAPMLLGDASELEACHLRPAFRRRW